MSLQGRTSAPVYLEAGPWAAVGKVVTLDDLDQPRAPKRLATTKDPATAP